MYTYPNQSQMFNQFQPQYAAGIPQMPKAKMVQPLTPENINRLRSSGDVFEVKVSEDDLLRSACTHKENGQPTLVVEGVNPETGNEILRCTICGETFEMIDAEQKDVQAAVDLIYNLLQTSKTMYLDAPAALIKQYYQMIPLLKMFPKLYERSQKNFAMYENAMNVNPGTTAVGTNGFQMMGAMLSNPYAAYGGYQQPVYPQQPMAPMMGYQQPVYPQQPVVQQPMVPVQQPQQYWGQPAPMMGNPVAYSGSVAPAPAPAPAQAPAAGVVPQAPADGAAEIQQQKQFNV